MSFQLTEDKFTSANKALIKDLHKTLGISKQELSQMQLLEKMSQAFFGKPFGEVQKTLLAANSEEVVSNAIARVFLINYGNETILSVDENFESCTYNGSDMQRCKSDLEDEAERIASRLNSFVKEISVPKLLDEDYNYEDVVDIAEEMGYFKHTETLFDLIDNSNSKVFIDGDYVPFSLDGEWMTEIVDEYDDEYCDDIGDYCIWHPEVGTSKDMSHKEFYFTYNDIKNARLQEDGSWLIFQAGNTKEVFRITIAFS